MLVFLCLESYRYSDPLDLSLYSPFLGEDSGGMATQSMIAGLGISWPELES